MDTIERDFHDDHSDFDDRLDTEDDFECENNDGSESFGDDEIFYRHLEEY